MNDRPRKSSPEVPPAPRGGTPSQEAVTLLGGAPGGEPLPARIGGYTVLRKLGEGALRRALPGCEVLIGPK